MPHFAVYPSQYAPFQIQAETDDWHRLDQTALDLLARLVNGDHSVLAKMEGFKRRDHGNQMVLVKDIDMTAKTLAVVEVHSSARVVPSQQKILLLAP